MYYVNLPYQYHTNPSEYYNGILRDHINQEIYRRSNSVQMPYIANVQYSYPQAKRPNQKLLIVRHGERVDSYYGSMWIQNSFTPNGQYFRSDANMPKQLIHRENPYEFEFDPPLTENGLIQAKIHGEELAKAGITISHMYSSPALRSIQTADKILEGMGLKDIVPIRIEVGLFELLSWQMYIPSKYPFIDKHKLRAYGYNIDLNYKSIIAFDNFKHDETINDYYQRSHFITKILVDKHALEGNLMFVGHAPTLEGCSRLLTGEKMRTFDEFAGITRQIPFLSIAQCEKNSKTGTWSLTPILNSYQANYEAYNSRMNHDHGSGGVDNVYYPVVMA